MYGLLVVAMLCMFLVVVCLFSCCFICGGWID